jgi:O-antigen/teichoic acid export membrane protein
VFLAFALVAAQSFDVFVVYRRAFVLATLVELVVLAITVAAVLAARADLTLERLIAIYALAQLFKTSALWWRFRVDVRAGRAGSVDPSWLGAALPFFLLGFTGLLQTRADLYVVSSVLPPADIGRYQVYINLIVYLQSIAALVLTPFVKGLYRLPSDRILAQPVGLMGLGAIVVATGIPASALVLREVYGLVFSAGYFVAGAAAVMPAFAYLPVIYALFKVGRPGSVVVTNVCGVGVSLVLMWWWLPRHGLLGAAWAAAGSQWAMLAVYGVLAWHLRERHAVPVSNLP